jgi:hypothetical protein
MDANAPGADTPGGDADRADAPGRDGRAPFAWSCPGCGADIDAPDQVFEVTAAALVPHANYLLVAVRCHTCERRTDAAVWIDRSALARQAEAGPGDLAPEVPESAALLDRYRAMVEESQARWERALGREEWVIEAEHASLHLEFETTRCTAVPARVVAEARGWRKALERQWGQLAPPVGALQVGHLLCVLSEDPMGGPRTRGVRAPRRGSRTHQARAPCRGPCPPLSTSRSRTSSRRTP